MKFTLRAPQLEHLDELSGTCLVLTCFADDRPLRGLTSLVDWRLNGQLSKLLLRDFVDGHFQESLLAPIHGRLPFGQILLIGMGKRSEFGPQRFEDICRFVFQTLIGLNILDVAMTLPGRVGLDVGLRQAMAGWRRALTEEFSPDHLARLEITLLEKAEVQREIADSLRQLERELQESLQLGSRRSGLS